MAKQYPRSMGACRDDRAARSTLNELRVVIPNVAMAGSDSTESVFGLSLKSVLMLMALDATA